MKHVDVNALPNDTSELGVVRRRTAEALDTSGLAINHYRVDPGAELPAGLHAHGDQEEVFAVVRGTATFETLPSEDVERHGVSGDDGVNETDGVSETDAVEHTDRVTVEAGDAVRFGPGEFQSCHNEHADTLVVLAVGAPRESDDLRFPVSCPACSHHEMRLVTDDGPTFVCPACSCEREPVPCPDCGGEDLRVRPDDDRRTVVECTTCGARFPTPPVRDEW